MKYSEMSNLELENVGKGVSVGGSKGLGGRNMEVLSVLKEGFYSCSEVGEIVDISNRNVSSKVCELNKIGYDVRSIKGGGEVRYLLISKKVGGSIVKGKYIGESGIVLFNKDVGLFEDEIVKEVKKEEVVGEVVEEVKKEEVKKKK